MIAHMNLALTSAVLDLGRETVIHLDDDLGATPFAVDSSFWTHSVAARRELSEGRVLLVSDYTTTWSWWERHPVGEELAFLISGDVELFLDDDAGQRGVALRPGQAVIVPEGAWHRLGVRCPSRLLFVTPTPARTQLREVAPDAHLGGHPTVARPTDEGAVSI